MKEKKCQVTIYVRFEKNPRLYRFIEEAEKEVGRRPLIEMMKEALEYFSGTGEFKEIGGVYMKENAEDRDAGSVRHCLFIRSCPALRLYVQKLRDEKIGLNGVLCNVLEKSIVSVSSVNKQWFLRRKQVLLQDGILKPDLEAVKKMREKENTHKEERYYEDEDDEHVVVSTHTKRIQQSIPAKKREGASLETAGFNKKGTNPMAGLMGYVSR